MKAFKCKKTYYHQGNELMFIKDKIYYGESSLQFPNNFYFDDTEADRRYFLQNINSDFPYYLSNIMSLKLFRYGK